jgi:hypothetical protein
MFISKLRHFRLCIPFESDVSAAPSALEQMGLHAMCFPAESWKGVGPVIRNGDDVPNVVRPAAGPAVAQQA